MAENSKIEWTDHTFNMWIGCQKVGPGCDFCYAEEMMDHRYGRVQWGPHGDRIRTSAANWRNPLKWEKHAGHFAELHRRRQRVFCASLADWADTHRSILPEWRRDLGALILATPSLDWLLLTKRIGNAEDALAEMFPGDVPGNVHIGITVVNQAEADRDIPKLLALKTNRRISIVFLSMEPLLGPVDLRYLQPSDPPVEIDALNGTHGVLRPHGGTSPRVDHVIVGGESGKSARPMHPDWVRGLRDQCEAAGTPFLMKQWGEWLPADKHLLDGGARYVNSATGELGLATRLGLPMQDDGDVIFAKVGKKAAGRLLDGVEHNGFPQ